MDTVREEISSEKLRKVAEIFDGLAHPARLRVLELLEEGVPKTVGEILDGVQIEPTLLSHHLKKMKHIGIVDSEKRGRHIYYWLVIKEISKVFDCIYGCKI